MKAYQQGDVIIARVYAIPSGAKPKKDARLAEGEVTGHYHEVVGQDVAVFIADDGSLYTDAPYGATVTHQEHDTITLPPGKYKSGKVLEYDHFAEEAKEVVD